MSTKFVFYFQSKYEALRRPGPATVDCDDFNYSSVPPPQAHRVADVDSFLFRSRPSNTRPPSVDTTKKGEQEFSQCVIKNLKKRGRLLQFSVGILFLNVYGHPLARRV